MALNAISTSGFSQVNPTDSAINIPMFSATYALQFPGGDMADRFGANSNIGGTFSVKTKSQWFYGVSGGFLFSDNVKETDVIDGLRISNGEIIDQNGEYALVTLMQRGFSFHGHFGRLFPLGFGNPNSGILVTAGAGFLQHKIRFAVEGNLAPQLRDEYVKGYDRLSNGFSTNQFIGYFFTGDSRLINFYAGVDFTQAFTQNRRSYNFDTMGPDDTQRTDLFYGIRLGWVIPIYKRATNDIYYY